jgi:hypothetical protein
VKRINLMSIFSWALAHISWLTMAFAPVAYGEQSKNMNAENLKIYAKEFGLNKKTTLAEFWEKSKYYYPGYMYKEIESFVQKNPNALMPQIDIKKAKASNGQDVPVISFIQNGKTQVVEYYGDSKKFIKMNGVILSESETMVPEKLFKKMSASEPKIAQQYQKENKKEQFERLTEAKRPFRDFKGLPRFNKKLWSAMSIRDRVSYIVEMRLLNERAERVLQLKLVENLKNSKKTSSLDYFKKYEATWTFLVGPSVEASPIYLGEHCINQGFVADDVSAYTKDSTNYRTGKNGKPLKVEACNLKQILSSPKYNGNKMIERASAVCSVNGSMPCNPMVYSYQSDGTPFCSKPQDDKSFQVGTHFSGSCDSQSRLSNGFIDGSNQGLRSESEQGQANNDGKDLTGLKHAEIQKLIKEDQARDSYKATEKYLQGMLASDNTKGSLLDQLNKKEWTPELEKELLAIQKSFEDNITNSMKACSADLNDSNKKHEPNYRDACEQLHRRWLFSQEIINQLNCKDGSKPIKDDKGNKACAAPVVPVVVIPPGLSCPEGSKVTADGKLCECPLRDGKVFLFLTTPEEPERPADCFLEAKEPAAKSCEEKYPGAKDMDKDCNCEDSKKPPEVKSQSLWDKMWHKEKPKEEQYECPGTNWWIVGGVVLGALALWAILSRDKKPKPQVVTGVIPVPPVNKPKPKPPKPKPPKPKPPGPVETCPAGQVGTYPNCTTPVITCPEGMVGTYPVCNTPPPTCSGAQVIVNGICACSNASSCVGSLNSTSCVCTPPPSEGGIGDPTCQDPPCSGGVGR